MSAHLHPKPNYRLLNGASLCADKVFLLLLLLVRAAPAVPYSYTPGPKCSFHRKPAYCDCFLLRMKCFV